ncbi:broad specificity phosphatase PhoE [Rhodoblastus sphagnicola]|uniref:hypothetical protein n=1 Tax=Rhodoblastus sphagnicola TaxID=333368 RepID=UPI0011B03864|nr:hypothetical protein [Rhodoblastus sphagnicola]MBB4196242.1 broad specificity phosphatase PhoE [Rhodoblastus sphagnicola]
MRHGPVACDRPFLPDSAGFTAFCAAYEQSGLAPGDPPARVAALCKGVRLFASTMPRAKESALRLAPEGDWLFDPVFGEESMVAPDLPGRWPLAVWCAASRGRENWSAGASAQREALRLRARRAAQLLIADAPSLLVGHGWFNRTLAATLLAQGFRCERTSVFSVHWGAQVLVNAF